VSLAPKNHWNWRLYTRTRDWTSFILSTCVKLLQSLWFRGFHFTQVPHTYQVSQPLSSHVSWSRNRHRKIAEIDVSRHGFEISLLLSCELVLNWLNRSCIVDSTLHTHPTHVLSPNHYLRMCLGKGTDIKKSLILTFVHQDTPCHFFCPVNLCQTTWIIEPCGISLYTRTPHIFCLPTTAITCVSTKEYEPEKRWNWRLYTKTRHVAAFIDSFNLCQTASIIEVLGIPLYTGTPHVLSLQTTDIACVSTME
jgi:hypothetical protein